MKHDADIVEWLRSGGEFEDGQRAPHTTMHRAADEIERLRTEMQRMQDEFDEWERVWVNKNEELDAELEQLRAQRDELLAPLQAIHAMWENAFPLAFQNDTTTGIGPVWAQVRAAIAKVEGK
jgi:septal ring factor EnvC (AmiA/AmiB activator)